MTQTKNRLSKKVKVKFSLDASSNEAVKKLQTERFKSSVRDDVSVVSRNTQKNK